MSKANPRTTQGKKLYFSFEFRNCPDLCNALLGLRTCSTSVCNSSVQFQIKIRKISRRRSRSPKYAETPFSHFTLLFRLGPGSDAVLHISRIEFEFRPTQINLDRRSPVLNSRRTELNRIESSFDLQKGAE